MRRAFGLTIPVVVACAAAAGCTSPEAARTRGGGAGADIGNRRAVVRMHEGSQPFFDTPERIGDAAPPVDAASQARELSRP